MESVQGLSTAKYYVEPEEQEEVVEEAATVEPPAELSTAAKTERKLKYFSIAALAGVAACGFLFLKKAEIVEDGYRYRPMGPASHPAMAVTLWFAGENPEEFNRKFDQNIRGRFNQIQAQLQESADKYDWQDYQSGDWDN